MVGEDLLTLAWYRGKRASKDVVVVEDQTSALKLSQDTHAAALLGTYLSESKAEEIRDQKYRYVYLCLDADATNQAITQALKLNHILPNIRVVALKQDIKDMNEHDYIKFLGTIGLV